MRWRLQTSCVHSSEAAAASRESSRDTLHLFLGQLPQTLQREVSPFTRSHLWRKARGETPKQRESDSSWLHLYFSVNFSWHEASEESRGTDGEMEGRGRRNYVWVQNVFSLYFGFVCLWHHLRAPLEWWQCQPEKQQPAHTPTHNQKTNAKYDHRQYERGTRQHPSDALKLQGWTILNGICNITFNFPSLWCSLISNYSISVQLWFIGETEHDSPNKHSAHKSLSFDVLRYVQGRRVKLHLCWEAGREVVCSALIQHISQKAFCSWKRPKTTCFPSLIKERKGCTILFLLHHISNINPILDRDAFTYIPFTFVCCSLYGV